MIRFVTGNELKKMPHLRHSMFQDRASQFSERLKWEVGVNAKGEEIDEYDELNPIYVVVESPDGSHAGSMRFLPTTGRTMVNEHFLCALGGAKFKSSCVWECTRFCVSESASKTTSAALMAAGGKLMLEQRLKHFIGVFDRQMVRVYRKLGSSPSILGWMRAGKEQVGVGLWQFSVPVYKHLLKSASLTALEMELFYANSSMHAEAA
ncbi:MAG: acyl-homoserine-lactone synthase [Paracoccaceae bacterium]